VHPFVITGTVAECARELRDLMDRHQLDEFLLPVLEARHAEHLLSVVSEVVARAHE
jgi:hypothetical protein